MTPLLTILVPTYKRAGPLARCLASIEAAGLPADDVEILVCDNASPDGTAMMLAGHASRHRLRHIRRAENLGARRNIRLGAAEAAGEWVMFLTDDDRLDRAGAQDLPRLLRERRDCGCILSAFTQIDDAGAVLGRSDSGAQDLELRPGAACAARWVGAGQVLSRLILRRDMLDLAFWDRHLENAYPSMLLVARSLLLVPGLYRASSLVDHTVGNLVHWEEYGDGQYEIWLRTHSDQAAVLDVVFADRGLASPECAALASAWRRLAFEELIAAAQRCPGGAARLWRDRTRLADAFRLDRGWIAWRIARRNSLHQAGRLRSAAGRLLRRAGLRA